MAEPGIYHIPEKVPFWEALKIFLYNPNNGHVLGRTCISWGKLLLFYTVFYSTLVVAYAIYWSVYRSFQVHNMPHLTLEESFIGAQPGLVVRPGFESGMTVISHNPSPLIYYNIKHAASIDNLVHQLDTFLEGITSMMMMCAAYRSKDGIQPHFICTPETNRDCTVNVNSWQPCTAKNEYSYYNGNPCVFLKLNKIIGWRPVFYNDTADLPKNMPIDLKNYIAEQRNSSNFNLNKVWVTCEGEGTKDKDNLEEVRYIERGFPGYFYPYENTEGYLNPLVAVQFRPKRNEMINVECKVWAKNIKHNRIHRYGVTHFQLFIRD